MKKKWWIIIGIVIILVAAVLVYLNYFSHSYGACTMEAKICPDGTGVGRNSSKNCEFDECPEIKEEYYIACGCGCCSIENPKIECLYKSKGDNLSEIIEQDKKASQGPDCPNMGCSYPVKYVYCNNSEKLKICPDSWVDNQMPCPCSTDNCSECNNPPREYFVIDGKRRELVDFDVDWVKQNCAVNKPDIAY